jgi:hypothetical protein
VELLPIYWDDVPPDPPQEMLQLVVSNGALTYRPAFRWSGDDSAPAQTAKNERKHREGKRTFTTHIFEQDYKTLKRAAVDYDTNVQALVDEALALLFEKKGYEKHRE